MLKCYFENVKYETQKYAAKSKQKFVNLIAKIRIWSHLVALATNIC